MNYLIILISGKELEKVHYKMGGLHIKLTAMSTIGDYLQDSELPLIWVEAGLASEGEVEKVLQGKDYEGGMRLHRISYQAGWRVIKPQFYQYLQDNKRELYEDVISLSEAQMFKALSDRLNNEEFFDELIAFIDMKKMDKNFSYMWNYMDMVQKLLSFTRGERTENFTLQMNAFTRMLDDFTRYGYSYCINIKI